MIPNSTNYKKKISNPAPRTLSLPSNSKVDNDGGKSKEKDSGGQAFLEKRSHGHWCDCPCGDLVVLNYQDFL